MRKAALNIRTSGIAPAVENATAGRRHAASPCDVLELKLKCCRL